MLKRKKIEATVGLMIIWSAVFLQVISLRHQKEKDRINEVFDILDSVPVEGCIELSAPFQKLYLEDKECETVLKDLANELGIQTGYELIREQEGKTKTVLLEKKGEAGALQLSITTVNNSYQYLYAVYSSQKKPDVMLASKEKIEQAFWERGLTTVSNINFKGEKAGKLSLEEQNKLAERLFYYLKAREVESVREEELFTIYGYSNLLKDSVLYGKKEINLNLIFTYEEEKDVTMFCLAMPYMKTDY